MWMKQFSNKGVRTSEATLGGFSSRMLLGTYYGFYFKFFTNWRDLRAWHLPRQLQKCELPRVTYHVYKPTATWVYKELQ
jgi:hypothetical protein